MEAINRLYKVVLEYTSIIERVAKPEKFDDVVTWLATLHALQIQAQALIDIVVKVSSLMGYTPSTPVEALSYLKKEGVERGRSKVY